MVPHTTGLLVPSPTSGRGPAWERRSLLKKVCILDPTQDSSRLGAEEEGTVTAGWQPPPHTHTTKRAPRTTAGKVLNNSTSIILDSKSTHACMLTCACLSLVFQMTTRTVENKLPGCAAALLTLHGLLYASWVLSRASSSLLLMPIARKTATSPLSFLTLAPTLPLLTFQ